MQHHRVEVVLAVVFAACTFDNQQNVGAVFEWVIALVFTFYVLTFVIDLLPASRGRQERTNREVLGNVEMGHGQPANGNGIVQDNANPAGASRNC